MKPTIIVAAMCILCIAGCNRKNPSTIDNRETDGTTQNSTVGMSEQVAAEKTSKLFAIETLGLESDYVSRLVCESLRTTIDGNPCIQISFYDPAEFGPRPESGYEAISGGFPAYFTITVDVMKSKVVQHYAASE